MCAVWQQIFILTFCGPKKNVPVTGGGFWPSGGLGGSVKFI
jgi:hypothetical protein